MVGNLWSSDRVSGSSSDVGIDRKWPGRSPLNLKYRAVWFLGGGSEGVRGNQYHGVVRVARSDRRGPTPSLVPLMRLDLPLSSRSSTTAGLPGLAERAHAKVSSVHSVSRSMPTLWGGRARPARPAGLGHAAGVAHASWPPRRQFDSRPVAVRGWDYSRSQSAVGGDSSRRRSARRGRT